MFVRGPKEKKSRALGENLMLKAVRSTSQKSALIRKPYRPGMHGKRRRMLSEYGAQLAEKQKVKLVYGLSERNIRAYVEEAIHGKKVSAPEQLVRRLELRLDNIVFRSGLAPARSVARQMVSHGHIWANGRRVSIPSQQMRLGDVITIRPQSREKKIFEDLAARMKKYDSPTWLALDKGKTEVKVTGYPTVEDSQVKADLALVIEYYSR